MGCIKVFKTKKLNNLSYLKAIMDDIRGQGGLCQERKQVGNKKFTVVI